MRSMTRTLVLLFGIVAVSSRAEAEPLFLAKQHSALHGVPLLADRWRPADALRSARVASRALDDRWRDGPGRRQGCSTWRAGIPEWNVGRRARPGASRPSRCVRRTCASASRRTPGPEPPDGSRSRWRRAQERMDGIWHRRARAAARRSGPAEPSRIPHSFPTSTGFRIRPTAASAFAPDDRPPTVCGSRIDTVHPRPLDLDRNDQVYGVEVSDTRSVRPCPGRHGSPGKAEAILHDRARRVLCREPLATRYRAARNDRRLGFVSRRNGRGSAIGVGRWRGGFAPSSRVSIWTEVDGPAADEAAGGRSWVVVNEDVHRGGRGIWLKLSPQFRSSGSAGSAGSVVWGWPRTCLPARTGT